MAKIPTGTQNTPENKTATDPAEPSASGSATPSTLVGGATADTELDSQTGVRAETGMTVAAPAEKADAAAGPWKTSPPPQQATPTPAPDKGTNGGGNGGKSDRSKAPKPTSGGKRLLILAILAVLIVAGSYATYPMWRSLVEPYATALGLTLPSATTVETPAVTATLDTTKPAAPQAATQTTTQTAAQTTAPAAAPAAPKTEPTAAAETAPAPPASAPDPSTAETLATLADRLTAVEARLASAEAAPSVPPSLANDLAALSQRLDDATRRITATADEVAIVREGLAAGGGEDGLGPLAASLSQKVQSVTDRIVELENRSNTPAVAPERFDELEAAIAKASERLTGEVDKSAEDLVRVEARLAGIEDRLDSLSQSLTQAMAQTRAQQAQAATFLIAASQLATAAASSRSFAAELAALRAAAPAKPGLDEIFGILAKHDAGVPSHAVLTDRFNRTASRVIDASIVGTDEGLVGQTLTRITALVSVRRTGSAPDGGINATLNEAEAALRAGDLAGAVKALDALDGDAAAAAADWLVDARARLALDDAVQALQSQALTLVSEG